MRMQTRTIQIYHHHDKNSGIEVYDVKFLVAGQTDTDTS